MKKGYLITFVISVGFLLPSLVKNCGVTEVLFGVGCSGIAASLMGLFIDWLSAKKEKKNIKKAKMVYFKTLYNQLKMMLERIVWYDDRMSDSTFDWNRLDDEYRTLNYMVWVSRNYKEYKLSYEEIEKRLLEIAAKYDLKQQENMKIDQKIHMLKMFKILGISGDELVKQINIVAQDKLIISAEGYMSLDDIEQLIFNISLAVGIMLKDGKNYGLAVSQIMEAYKLIEKIYDEKESFNIGLHGAVSLSEL